MNDSTNFRMFSGEMCLFFCSFRSFGPAVEAQAIIGRWSEIGSEIIADSIPTGKLALVHIWSNADAEVSVILVG